VSRVLVSAGAFATALAIAAPAAAYCPSYSASSLYNEYGCAIEATPGVNPSTEEWNAIFDLVSRGPAVWGDAGPSVDDIGAGCGVPEPLHEVPARFPCELLKGITRQESGWRQFCVPDLPDDQIGGAERTIISFDCGYGVGQVTSGMHEGETPDFDRERVAGDATYNLATGTRILAAKWSYTACVGDNQPTTIEHWYAAAWAYNGLAYVNNPNNPNYDPGRGVWDPEIGGGAPYQEKVFGWIEHTGGLWVETELAYPNPGDIGGDGSPATLPEPACASPTDCVGVRSTHTTACDGDGEGGAGGGSTSNGTGGGAVGGGFPGTGGSLDAASSSSASSNAASGGEAPAAEDVEGSVSCGCRVPARSDDAHARWLALGLLLGALARRRR
jgi:hypothetical protein